MNQRPWTTGELQVLRNFSSLGSEGVAALLERSQISVKHKAQELRISLQQTGQDIEINTAVINMIERVKESPLLQICPMCGRRLANMRLTGMCRPCHLDRLIRLQEEQLEVKLRQLRLDKIRQAKHRARVCDRCDQAFYPKTSSKKSICGECS